MSRRIISADSHVTEPPDCYAKRMPSKYSDRVPHIEHDDAMGDLYIIPGMKRTSVPVGLIAGAGKSAKELATHHARFEDLHAGGWDSDARLLDQDRDGVHGEIVYPTVGMVLCNHPDIDYKRACMQAYNLWVAEFAGKHPDRIFGIGQTAMRTPEEGIEDLKSIKALGLKGVMMPGNPGTEDYDSRIYDRFYETAIELEMPLSFHILTSSADTFGRKLHRGPKLNGFCSIIRGCQDIIGMFILGGVFERHPKLKLVCVEADAGWVPHYMYRMDHGYDRHRYWLTTGKLTKLPSEYFSEHIYTTFQDDWVAFKTKDLCNIRRLMWANDFPHSDSTWPNSQALLAKHAAHLTEQERDLILHDNVAELYGLDAVQTAGGAS